MDCQSDRACRAPLGTGCLASAPPIRKSGPMSTSDRLRYGRFYTPPGVVDLTLSLAGLQPTDRLWDPTCGNGAFLRRAAEGGHPQQALYGHDLDTQAITEASSALPRAHVCAADLFALSPEETGLFDVIAGNPPYVRVERLGNARRLEIARGLEQALGFAPPSQTDLSILALLQCSRFLAPGGRLAFVLPNTWMDTDCNRPVRRWLLARLGLRAVVESRIEPWFPHARVNTVIAVFERNDHSGVAPDTAFGQLLAPADSKLAEPILDESSQQAQVRVRRLSLATLRDGTGTTQRWGPLLRAPDSYFDVLHKAGDKLSRLGDLRTSMLSMGYGTKVGISSFFSPRRTQRFEQMGVEDDYLVPFFRSLRGLDYYTVGARHTASRLFFPPDQEAAHQPAPGAARYVEWGAKQRSRQGTAWPEVPSVRNNDPWFRLSQTHTGDFLLPQFRMERHHVLANPEHVLVNNSAWWGTWADSRHREVGTALLNSSWVALSAEVEGRVNLGDGLLCCYGPDIDAISMPNPDLFVTSPAGRDLLVAWRSMFARRALPFREEVGKGDRQALDEAVLSGLGLPRSLGAKIRKEAARMCEDRLRLATTLREQRRKVEA